MVKKYKEDSVMGRRPEIDPINYKPDVLVQVWLEARVLLMLNNWLTKYDRKPRFMGDIIKFVVEEVLDQLLEAGEVKKIEFSSTARDALRSLFAKHKLNPGDRGKRRVLHNLHLDEKRKKGLENSDIVGNIIQTNSGSVISDDGWERTQAKIKELDEQERQDMLSNLKTDDKGMVLQPDMKGTYTAEQRELDVAKARDALGLNNHDRSQVHKVQPIPKETLKEIDSIFNTIKARTKVSPSTEPVSVKYSKSTPASSQPAKVTLEQTQAHIDNIKDKDKQEQDSWDSVEVGDLRPIK